VRAISCIASASTCTFSAFAMCDKRPTMWSSLWRRNTNCWQRPMTVSGIFCASVVHSTNTTWAGGSSSVLSKALNAGSVSMCASSMM
jgi:hypothetical protein